MAVYKQILIAGAVAALIAGCASSKPDETAVSAPPSYKYPADMTLSSRHVASEDDAFMVQVPEGWQRAAGTDEASGIILWLVNNEYTASITFMPITMDPALYTALKRDGLPAVTKVSMSLKEGNTDSPVSVVQRPEPFTLGGREFYAYEYTVNNKATIVRVAVFDTGTSFIECACVPAAEQTTPAVQRDLFRAQQTVLSTLEIR